MHRGVLLLGLAVGLLATGQGHAQRRPARRPPAEIERPAPVLVPDVGWAGLYRRHRADIVPGLNPRVRVLAPSRFDYIYAVAPSILAATPKEVLAKYDPTQTYYQLFVPRGDRHDRASPLILFLSASDNPDELTNWGAICRKYGVLYASPHNAGNACPYAKRARIALDVLDDVRRRMNVDTDRIYIGGLSEGARTACDISFAFAEFIGGTVAVSGGSSLRGEPWLRDRVRERSSVALVTGALDVARPEMERYRYPVLRELEVRTKLWIVPRLGHTMPPAVILEEVFLWLEEKRSQRRNLGDKYPTLRMAEGVVPASAAWAQGVLDEAKTRLDEPKTRDSGLMQLEGITQRWKASSAAKAAEKLLREHDVPGAAGWKTIFKKRQQEFFAREAKGVDAWLAGPLPLRDQRRKLALERLALELWKQVLDLDPDTKEGKEASTRIAELNKRMGGR